MTETLNEMKLKNMDASDDQGLFSDGATKDDGKVEETLPQIGESSGDLSRIREGRAIAHAQETLDLLKRQLVQKGDLVSKYREMLKTSRQEFNEKLQLKDVQIQGFQLKLQEYTLKELDRLEKLETLEEAARKKEREETNAIAEALKIEKEIVTDLQKLVSLKDEKLQTAEKLKVEVEELRKSESRYKAQEKKHETLLSDFSTRENEMKETIQDLQVELERAREILAIPTVEDFSEEVTRLRKDVMEKEKKMNALKKTIYQLKLQLQTISCDLAESKAKESLLPQSNPQDVIIQETMAVKIAQLESKNKRLHEQNENIKKEKEILQAEMEKVNDAWQNKTKEVLTLRKTIDLYKSPHSSGKSIEHILNNLLSLSKHHGTTSNWELEKNKQRKLESLKESLKTKTAEAESLAALNTQLRDGLARSEKDRTRLMNQFKMHEVNVNDDGATKEEANKELILLNEKVHTLQMALARANSTFRVRESKDSDAHGHVADMKKKYDEIVKKHDLLKSKLDESISQVQRAEQDRSIHVIKVTEENQKLRVRLKKEADRVEITGKQLSSVLLENDTLQGEIKMLKGTVRVYSRESLSEDKAEIIRDLRKELEEKDRAMHEMMAADGSARLTNENRRLKRELEVLQLRCDKLL